MRWDWNKHLNKHPSWLPPSQPDKSGAWGGGGVGTRWEWGPNGSKVRWVKGVGLDNSGTRLGVGPDGRGGVGQIGGGGKTGQARGNREDTKWEGAWGIRWGPIWYPISYLVPHTPIWYLIPPSGTSSTFLVSHPPIWYPSPIWYPIPDRGYPLGRTGWHEITLKSHQSGILHSLIFQVFHKLSTILEWKYCRLCFVVWLQVNFGDHLWSIIILEPSWMVAITRNHKKLLPSLRVNIETCKRNQTPPSLGQTSNLTCCQPSWMVTISRYHKSDCHNSQNWHRDCCCVGYFGKCIF